LIAGGDAGRENGCNASKPRMTQYPRLSQSQLDRSICRNFVRIRFARVRFMTAVDRQRPGIEAKPMFPRYARDPRIGARELASCNQQTR